jgi:hypothetical protein
MSPGRGDTISERIPHLWRDAVPHRPERATYVGRRGAASASARGVPIVGGEGSHDLSDMKARALGIQRSRWLIPLVLSLLVLMAGSYLTVPGWWAHLKAWREAQANVRKLTPSTVEKIALEMHRRHPEKDLDHWRQVVITVRDADKSRAQHGPIEGWTFPFVLIGLAAVVPWLVVDLLWRIAPWKRAWTASAPRMSSPDRLSSPGSRRPIRT